MSCPNPACPLSGRLRLTRRPASAAHTEAMSPGGLQIQCFDVRTGRSCRPGFWPLDSSAVLGDHRDVQGNPTQS
jgi:hypothetical protein